MEKLVKFLHSIVEASFMHFAQCLLKKLSWLNTENLINVVIPNNFGTFSFNEFILLEYIICFFEICNEFSQKLEIIIKSQKFTINQVY